jgi:hypothetical protein
MIIDVTARRQRCSWGRRCRVGAVRDCHSGCGGGGLRWALGGEHDDTPSGDTPVCGARAGRQVTGPAREMGVQYAERSPVTSGYV